MIRLCRENPLVVGTTGEEKIVRGPSALLLRVLLLAPEAEVPVEAAITSIEINKTGFGKYVDMLRTDLGDKDLIIRKKGAVRYAGDREQTDAGIIHAKYEEILEILGLVDGNGRKIDHFGVDADIADNPVLAEKILPLIEDIEELYAGNPTIGLDVVDWPDYPRHLQAWAQGMSDVASDWIDLWTLVQLLGADCKMLLNPSKTTAGKLVTSLLKIARVPDPVDEVWPRLLRAAEMTQNLANRKRVWNLASEFYHQSGEELPEALREYEPPVPSLSSAPTSLHRSRPLVSPLEPTHEGLDNLREMAEVLGITTGSTLKLRGEAVDPMQCIEQTKNLLYFSGVLASKWVLDPGVRNAFDELLTRLDDLPEKERDVRFLIMDPDGDAYSLLYQMRGGRLSNEAVPHLKELARRHPSFQVAVIDALPSFRIVVIDEEMVSFSPYALEEERYATSKLGWDAPHVVLDPRAPYPLAEAFKLYFKERWDHARLL